MPPSAGNLPTGRKLSNGTTQGGPQTDRATRSFGFQTACPETTPVIRHFPSAFVISFSHVPDSYTRRDDSQMLPLDEILGGAVRYSSSVEDDHSTSTT